MGKHENSIYAIKVFQSSTTYDVMHKDKGLYYMIHLLLLLTIGSF